MGYFSPKPEKNIFTDVILKWIVDILLAAVVAIFVIQYFGESINVAGNSMNPILEDKETVLVNKLSYEIAEPERFDVIAYNSRAGEISVKRIIGLPGETIQIVDNTIYIDGEVLEDEYYDGTFESGYISEAIRIESNEYFVMGDNRNVSEDSRFEYVGNINRDDILGEAWFICAPFSKIGPV